MDYTQLRHMADSWGLLFMMLVMIGVLAWVFRPGASQAHEDARMIPFRDDEAQK